MIKRPYELVVFDWEGTIADTLGPIILLIIDEAKALDLPPVDSETIRAAVQLGLSKAIQKLFPTASLHQHEQLIQAVQLNLHCKHHSVCLMPGVEALIKQLHHEQVNLAIASNKGYHSLQKAIQLCQLNDYFQVIRCAGQVPAKPCPQMLKEIMAAYSMSPEQTLMIGDSTSDMEMAKAVGVKALGMDFYHQQEASLLAAGADEIFSNYQEVARYLELF